MHSLLQIAYIVSAVGLGLYGFQALWLTFNILWRSGKRPIVAPPHTWPAVTVQLPLYNERHVVERLLRACADLDYPRDRLQIQVLDDSDDATAALTTALAQQVRNAWLNIEVVRRPDRTGYKAGALAYALRQASGEFIAIFDADFVPTSDFLKVTLPYFFDSCNAPSNPVGFVQARWDHLNRDYSWLTKTQALALDGHFVVEQTARATLGYPFGFNGTAGVWRRACIEDPGVGGWQTDTLCEDLDLSYRAQLSGWRGVYVRDVGVPAELPAQLLAFKRQQFRWAKGSIQTLRKLAHRIPRAPWSAQARVAAIGHLGNYLIHPLLLAMLLLSIPMTLLGVDPAEPLAVLSLFSLGPPILYAVAQRHLHPRTWLSRWAWLPLLMLVGTGLCLNNSIAAFQALTGKDSPFLRTPKFQLQQREDRWQHSAYRLPLPRQLIGEALLALYAFAAAGIAAAAGHWAAVPFLLIYAGGFGVMVTAQIAQEWDSRRSRRRYHRPIDVSAEADSYQG